MSFWIDWPNPKRFPRVPSQLDAGELGQAWVHETVEERHIEICGRFYWFAVFR